MYYSALVRVTAFVKGLALLHFQGLLKQMQDSLTTRRTKAIQEKKFDLFVSVDLKKVCTVFPRIVSTLLCVQIQKRIVSADTIRGNTVYGFKYC